MEILQNLVVTQSLLKEKNGQDIKHFQQLTEVTE